jgi:hypothetical protein
MPPTEAIVFETAQQIGVTGVSVRKFDACDILLIR